MDDELKASLGREVTFTWLGMGFLLFLFDDASPGLISWQAAVFLIGGMFVAAVGVGVAVYGLAEVLMDGVESGSPARWKRVVTRLANTGLAIGFPVGVYAALFWR